MEEPIRYIRINEDGEFQTIEEKLEIFRRKINEIISVVNCLLEKKK